MSQRSNANPVLEIGSNRNIKMAGDDCFNQEDELQICSSLLCNDVTVEETKDSASSTTPRDAVASLLPPSETNGHKTERTKLPAISKVQWFAVAILCYVNLVNFMDQYIPAGEVSIRNYLHFNIIAFGHRILTLNCYLFAT